MHDKHDRARAIHTAEAWVAADPVFLDTETTGLESYDEICELAVVDLNGHTLLDTLLKPTRPIPRSVSGLHGITDEMVAQAPAFVDVAPQLREVLTGRVVVIYNADYDVRMLRQSARAHGQALDWEIGRKQHCAMKLYARFHGEWNSRRGSYKWQQLGVAARQCNLELPPDVHRARADADLARRIVLHMANAK